MATCRKLLQYRGVTKKLQEHLATDKNKTSDSVTQDGQEQESDCQRSNERLMSSVLSRRLKAISDGDAMTSCRLQTVSHAN